MKSNNTPTFFIIGAPKCGTTAISNYLGKHPEIYFSSPKEPHYFNDDFSFRHTTSLDQYLSYFSGANNNHKVIGEGSVFYLYSESAVNNILSFNPDAKFIVMVRNPIEIAYSWHRQSIQSFGEMEYDFEKAWKLNKIRREGRKIPLNNLVREALHYDLLPKLGEQIERLLNKVDRKKIHFIIYDDFKRDVRLEYLNTLKFLEVSKLELEDYSVINSSKNYKSIYLKKFLSFLTFLKIKFNIKGSLTFGLIGRIDKNNTTAKSREALSSEFENDLKNFFLSDVEKLSALLKKDLVSLWGFNEIEIQQ